MRRPELVAIHKLQQFSSRAIEGDLVIEISIGFTWFSCSRFSYGIWRRAETVKRIPTLRIGDKLSTQIVINLIRILLLIQSYFFPVQY